MLTLLPLAQAAPAGGLFGNPLLLLGLLFAVMYFTMIRPQAKQAKAHRALVEGLSKGDRVVTMGGIHGQIRQVDEKSVLLEVDGGTKLRVDKGKVAYIVGASTPPA
ncbi:preprotein translocase subunit YajC [Rubrivirga sp.]|uniref:preprotein translocase subunit YajC n=1 Tax=Rubrivirga sp. TaxID=1885344 RepID=UPI003C711949